MALLDWTMPELEGPDVCRRARESVPLAYLILVTAKDRPQDIAERLRAGAHDSLSKPFHPAKSMKPRPASHPTGVPSAAVSHTQCPKSG